MTVRCRRESRSVSKKRAGDGGVETGWGEKKIEKTELREMEVFSN